MIRVAIVGDIGSGKTFISNLFRYPVFNADAEVINIYKKNKNCFLKIKKEIPNHFSNFPLKKKELISSILKNKNNLKKISQIVHPIVRKKLNLFLKKNHNKKIIILDIPLFFENKLNKKNDVIIFIQSKKEKIIEKLRKRKNYNDKLIKQFKKIQISLKEKRKKSNFVIKNNYKISDVKKQVNRIIKKINTI